MIYERDYEYLTDFYRRETKTLMERGFSNIMVVGFYSSTLENNAHLDKPKDLSNLEGLVCHYIMKDN